MKPDSALNKQKILDAAAETFATEGFAGARVDGIAAAAGLNKRLLYHYVGAKAELLKAVLTREVELLTERSLDEPRLWRLMLEEAAHVSDSRLADALGEKAIREYGNAAKARLAMAMQKALLPRLLQNVDDVPASEAGAAGPQAGKTKPRVRMQPTVSGGQASARMAAKREK